MVWGSALDGEILTCGQQVKLLMPLVFGLNKIQMFDEFIIFSLHFTINMAACTPYHSTPSPTSTE
jgi:hypothetical protein